MLRKKLLLIVLLIVGWVFAQSKELSNEYKYKYFIGTYPIWHNKDISGVDAPFNFVFNIRLDKPFGFGFEYVKSEPFQLVYVSPSVKEPIDNMIVGIFIYKVNHDYQPPNL